MRRLPVISGALAATAIAVAACGGTPAASSLPTIPAIVVPTLPPINVPSIPPIGSFSIPSFTTNADPELAARFPTTVAGKPVTPPQTSRYIEFLAAYSADHPERILAFQQAMAAIGVDPNQVSFGTATTTVGDNNLVTITAIRTPGVDASKLLSALPALAAAGGATESPPTIAQTTIGGKTVTTLTDPDGSVSYAYVNGDVAWGVASDDPAELEAVFSALP